MWLTNSSVGRKIVMSLTGLFLILFVTFHVLMNAVAIISPEGYDAVCHFLGANWYALVATAILAAGTVIHILFAFWLTLQNRKARGNDAYKVSSRPKSVEWASQNMLVLGIIIVVFLAVHFIQFWYKMQWQELVGSNFTTACGMNVHPADGQFFLYYAFKDWWTLVIYAIGFVALWFHMSHGFWSSLQSLGANGKIWMGRLRKTSMVWATLVCGLFLVEAVVFTVRANDAEYVQTIQENVKAFNADNGNADCKTVCTEAADAEECKEACKEAKAEECKAACEKAENAEECKEACEAAGTENCQNN